MRSQSSVEVGLPNGNIPLVKAKRFWPIEYQWRATPSKANGGGKRRSKNAGRGGALTGGGTSSDAPVTRSSSLLGPGGTTAAVTSGKVSTLYAVSSCGALPEPWLTVAGTLCGALMPSAATLGHSGPPSGASRHPV